MNRGHPFCFFLNSFVIVIIYIIFNCRLKFLKGRIFLFPTPLSRSRILKVGTLSFFQKNFVALKLQTNKDVTLSKHHRPSTLPVPLAVPKTYSSFQHLFLEAELQKSTHSPFFKKNLRCFEIRQNIRRVIYQ